MSGMQITITTAGLAALVNAQNTGTNAVLVSQVGVTDTAFTPTAATTTIPAEIKRIATFSGSAVSDDTVHITVRDDTDSSYELRGFGLYLDDGTLFAVYSQATPIVEKSAQALMLLSVDIRFTDIDATSITFSDALFVNPPASETVQGVLRLATNPESIAGMLNSVAVPPSGLKAAIDDRLGTGAPTPFVKGLLNLATANLFRIAIGLGDLALKNGGAGNGADADLLDGQHGSYYRAWSNLTGVPLAFPPTPHGHAWTDLSGVPSTASRWPTWLEVTDKPATFAPAAHVHSAAEITSGVLADARIPVLAISKTSGLQGALDGKANLSGANFTGAISAPAISPSHGTQGYEIGWNGLSPGYGRNEYINNIGSGSGGHYFYWRTTPGAAITLLAYMTAGIFEHGGDIRSGIGHIGSAGAACVISTGSPGAIYFLPRGRNDESVQVTISSAGTVTAPSMNATSSDARLKHDVADLRGCLDTLMRIRPRSWKWNRDNSDDFGFIAQEHAEVLPQAVHEADDGMLFVRYGKAEALLVGAVQELCRRIEALEQRIA